MKICNQIGHKTALFQVKSKAEFQNTCKFISSMDQYKDDENKDTLFIHLSMHGSETGLAFGCEDLKWKDLFDYVKPICTMKYSGEKIFTISACYTVKQKLSKDLKKAYDKSDNLFPPRYLFISNDVKINWSNVIVAWTILFHQLPEIKITDNNKVKELLESINKLHLVQLKYYRWDDKEKKYKWHTANKVT
jgi:hypothetical protein